MKLLFKQAFKSLFSNKIFTSIMILIVLISGTTYTLFESTSKSFNASYNKLIKNGNLHDAIIKQDYSINGAFTLKATTPIHSITTGKYTGSVEWHVTSSLNNDYQTYLSIKYPTKPKDPKAMSGPIESISASSSDEYTKNANNIIANMTPTIYKNVSQGKSIDFTKAVTEIYKDDLATTNTKSIAISNSTNSFKAVTTYTIDPANAFIDGTPTENGSKVYNKANIHNVNKLVMYDGTNQFTHDASYINMEKELRYRAAEAYMPPTTPINRSKGYRWSMQDNLGKVVSLTDPSSYEAVISPSYANINDKISISPNDFFKLCGTDQPDQFMQKLVTEKDLQNQYARNLIWIDKTPYFIIGIGTTPDFAYPIIDGGHPIPDIKTQAIVFLNRRGYERIHDAFRSAPNENYISLKFKNGLSDARKSKIKSEIGIMARTGEVPPGSSYKHTIPKMSWPSNIKIVTDFSESNDGILLAEQRVAFLIKLKTTLTTISRMTTIMLLIFIGSIIILVFSSLLETKRKVIATLLSLGYKRSQIALSFATISLIIAAIPSLIGYVVGHFLQYGFINLFNNYWTIPIYGEVFSWISLIIVVMLPFIAVFLLIFLICLYQTRHNIINMLKDNVIKFNAAPKILEYFKWFGVKFKYSISLMINNFWKLLLVSLTGVISVSAIIIGFATINEANYAYNATSQLSNYTYKVDLYTPTIAGGTYNDVNTTQLENLLYGKKHLVPIGPTYPHLKPTPADDAYLNKPHWHIPGIGDKTFAMPNASPSPDKLKYIAHYLRYKLQTKMLLDYKVANAINPWNIAKKLMPDNQRNIANENSNIFKNVPESSGITSVPPTTKTGTFNENFIKNYFDKLLNYQNTRKIYPYTISYQNILTNMTDETYTYISAEYKRDNQINKYNIIGYNRNTKYLNIPNDLTQKLIDNENNKNIPILINKYIEEKFGLNVGDKINMFVDNETNRFQNTNNTMSKISKTFQVQGVLNTYDNDGIFTLQSIANKTIGMDKILQPKEGLPNNYFNGVFTNQKSPILLNSLPLYSPSGIYVATDDINSGVWSGILQQIIGDPKLFNSKYVHNVPSYISKYGSTPLVNSFSNINWKSINEYTFKNISTLSSYLIFIIQLISILLSILFAIIVSSLFIDANKKRIATLWTLGYRKQEIIKIFLCTYTLPMFISILFSIPISFAIVAIMRLLVMNFAFILIPFAIAWWMPIVAVLIIALIFTISIIIAIFKIKGNTALEAFKEE